MEVSMHHISFTAQVRTRIHYTLLLTFFLPFLTACNDGNALPSNHTESMNIKPLLQKLNQKKFYFQHQSVGNNIISGIRLLAEDTHTPVNIVALDTDAKTLDIPQNGLAHSRGGKNRFPFTKIDSFVTHMSRFVESGKPDVAFMKFCYIDFDSNTDVDALFQKYAQTVEQLQNRFPDIRFVHLTAPLTTRPPRWKTLTKTLLGKNPVADGHNLQRHRFNQLIRTRYPADRIFDLARYESTRPDGTRITYASGDAEYHALVPTYTEDGGHLNETGRRIIATKFIEFLANLQ